MDETNFISHLNRFFNYGYSGKVDKLAACIDLSMALQMNASNISKRFKSFSPASDSNETVTLQLSVYDGKNEVVNKLGEYLSANIKDAISHAIIHGSVATGEENNYSDFDGLVVLKDEIFSDTNRLIHTARHLNRSYKMMLSYDRFQHHGWFILCEKHLNAWPCSYFPPEILKYSKSIGDFNSQIKINFNESNHYSKTALINHCNNIIQKLNKSGLPDNIFQLKSLFSEYMLIPSIYVQVKTGKGIFKKNSFSVASKDFSIEDWQIMNDISEIRNQWPDFKGLEMNYDYFSPVTRYRQIHDRNKLPENITHQLNDHFINRMIQLGNLFIQKINGTEIH